MKHPSPTSMWNSAFKDRLVLVLWTAQFDLWIVSYMTSHFRLDPCIKTRMTTMARKHCEKKVKLKTRLLDFLKYFLLIIFFFQLFFLSIFNDRLKILRNQREFLVTAWGKLRSNVQKENEVKLRNFIVDALFEEETFTNTVSPKYMKMPLFRNFWFNFERPSRND